jgi:aspartyl-tRNA(Asn)/glutamyl-tRNA(Gln) amidotransferase subunit C
MSISKKEAGHIASLSRLKLSQTETENFSKELTEIFGYIDKLKKLKTNENADSLGKPVNKTRDDEIADFKGKEKLFKNAPKVTNHFIEVKGVFK